METCRDCRSFENECPLLKMRGPYSTYPDHVCKFFWNKNKRIIRLTVDHRGMPRCQSTGEIPIDIPRNDIFDWLKAKYPSFSDKNIISISAELIEPDGCEYRSVGDYDWILVKREL